MTKTRPSLLVTGLCPDGSNTNSRIRQAVSTGANQTQLFSKVDELPIEGVIARKDIDYDIVLAVGSGTLDTVPFENIHRRVQKNNGVVIFWTHEDPYEFDLNRRLLPYCDLFFTNEKSSLSFYNNANVSWLPLAADLSYSRPLQPFINRSLDMFFCGYGYPLRMHILEKFIASDVSRFNVGIFGPNLRPVLGTAASDRRLSTDEMADICASSRLVLNIGRDLNIANNRYNIVAETPGPRTFDVALSGAPQILFNDGVLIDHFYEPGKEIILFDNISDIIDSLDMLNKYPAEGEKVAQAAQKRTQNQHLYRHRIVEMMEILGDI